MQVGRNDPCPCGSGKKYKKCCLDLDRQAGLAGSQASGQVRAIAREAAEWQTDVVALPAGLDDDPAARLAVLLVVSDGLVVESEVLNRPSPEPPAMAEAMAKALLAAGERIGRLPARVAVREPEVAEELRASRRSSLGTVPGLGRNPTTPQ
jgi:hypothetical protein